MNPDGQLDGVGDDVDGDGIGFDDEDGNGVLLLDDDDDELDDGVDSLQFAQFVFMTTSQIVTLVQQNVNGSNSKRLMKLSYIA